MRTRILSGIALGLTLWIGVVRAEAPPAFVRETAMVAMRDGVRLATEIWRPNGTGPWPVALVRTPYGRTSRPGERFTREGIALVVQDARGRFASEGVARAFVDDGWGELQDGKETVDWLRKQPWCNGKIATFGGSAEGITQLMLAGAGPNGIVGQHVGVAPVSLYHYAIYQNGAFRKALVEDWLRLTRWPPEVLLLYRQHASEDAFWRDLDLRRRRDRVRWPIVLVGGWFDIFTQGTLDAFTELQARGGEGARGRQHLVIGPWIHGPPARRAGELTFPENAVGPPGMPDTFQWLSFWLKGAPSSPAKEPPVRYYVMGDVDDPKAPGNTWRTADRWPPPARSRRLYFTAEGALSPDRPETATTREYDYDPANPVPTVGGAELSLPSGPRDQRSVEGRNDVLVFTTPTLDAPREVTGRIRVRLTAATSARDTDFTAKLCDVYPDGRSMLITDGIVSARYRRSLKSPRLVSSGTRQTYDIDLWSTSIVFNRGHRIRVAISSSNAPRFEPNLNTGEPWRPGASATSPVVAHQTVTLGGSDASHIILPEVEGGIRGATANSIPGNPGP
jgi:predicted acyl esterase